MHVLAQLKAMPNFQLDVNSFMSDFERAIINAGNHHFPDATHNGCFFHFKQAIRKHMVNKLGFHREYVGEFMQPGQLDLLNILPHDEIKEYGIPFLRDRVESNLSELSELYKQDGIVFDKDEELDRWDIFWQYFKRQWLPIKDSWNFYNLRASDMNELKQTNNGLESYNRRFHELFKRGAVGLDEFVEVCEKESRDQAEALEDIRKGKCKVPKCYSKTVLEIPDAYYVFKEQAEE